MSEPHESSEIVTGIFHRLFQAHGLPCEIQGGWIMADSGCLAGQARIFSQLERPGLCSIQLDFEMRTPSGRNILESCAGIGDSIQTAIEDAVRRFCDGTFHVLYSSLTGLPCDHCEVEDWVVGGVSRKVFIGPVVGRGDREEPPPTAWFSAIEPRIKALELSPGLHWLRLYHSETTGAEATNEALLDNDYCPDLQTCLASLEWPHADGFYSVRLFLILTDP